MMPPRSFWLLSCAVHATVIGGVVLGATDGKPPRRPAVHVLPAIEQLEQGPQIELPAIEPQPELEPEPQDLVLFDPEVEMPVEMPFDPAECSPTPAELTPIEWPCNWPTRDARLDLTVVRLSRSVAPLVPEAAAAPPSPPAQVSPPTTVLTVVPGTNLPPVYPLLARRSGWQGTVLLRVRCDVAGGVIAIDIVRSSGRSVLDEAALAAVRGWQFEGGPGELDVPIEFRLRTDPW